MNRVLLLLSGGNDSHLALKKLLADGYEVVALTIDGIQGKEILGAKAVGAETHIVESIRWFDEETHNKNDLLARDLAMLGAALHWALECNCDAISAGVISEDYLRLPWLKLFVNYMEELANTCGIRVVLPLVK